MIVGRFTSRISFVLIALHMNLRESNRSLDRGATLSKHGTTSLFAHVDGDGEGDGAEEEDGSEGGFNLHFGG